MKIKFLKNAKIEDTDIPEGSVVEMEDISAKSFIKSKDAIEYTDEVEGKEKSMAVKEIVEKSINVIVKDNKEVKMNDYVIGKMLQEVREKAVTGMSIGTAADGGALISTAIAQLMEVAMEGSKIYGKCRKIKLPQGYNSCKIVTDASEPIIRASAPVITSPAEGADKTATKLAFGNYTATLVKSVLYIPLTDELLQDAQGLDGYVRDYMRGKAAADVDVQILNGAAASTGFIGITTAGTGASAYRVAQAWTTPTIDEVGNFMRNVHPIFADRAEWFMNPTQWFTTVSKLVTNVANTSGMIVNPAAMTLMGKKVNVMAGITSGAGVLYGDFSQYTVVEPSIQQGLKISEHIRFYNDETVYRLVNRFAGGPTFLARTLADGSSSAAFSVDDGLTS
jgi:HK97 family phage major capsid protein